MSDGCGRKVAELWIGKEGAMGKRNPAVEEAEKQMPESPGNPAALEPGRQSEGERDQHEGASQAHDDSNQRCVLDPIFFDCE